jgi:hypothetical protein
MRIVSLTMVAFFAAAAVIPAVAAPSACRPNLTAGFGPALDTFAPAPAVQGKSAARCPSPARRREGLPVCNTGPSITCRGTCSNGAEWFSWQCCIGQDGWPPACYLDCRRQIADCLAQ